MRGMRRRVRFPVVFGRSTLQGGVVARGVVSTVTVVVKRIPTSTPTVVLAGLWVCSFSYGSRGGRRDGAREGGGALCLLMLLVLVLLLLVLVLLLLLLVAVSGSLV